MRASCLSLLLLATSAAIAAGCGAPDEWNGLSGGAREDANLNPPRQISPISVSLVSTARPKFRWELGEAMTGAIVELCRTRACEGGPAKTFEVSGRELVVPEDLERGVWFWRLKGRGEGKIGSKTSPTWELVVRGPAATGESDAPTGSMLDLNGDGLPDLVTVGDVTLKEQDFDPTRRTMPWTRDITDHAETLEMVYLSHPDGSYGEEEAGETWPTMAGYFDILAGPNVALAGGTDLDGDGFSDYANAGLGFDDLESPNPQNVVFIGLGGANWTTEGRGTAVLLPSSQGNIPSLGEAGDTNGDGYGDLFIGMPDHSYTAMGESKRPGTAVVPLYWPFMKNTKSPAVLGAFDANADGISDLVTATTQPNTLAVAAPGTYAASRDSMKMIEVRPPTELSKASAAPAATFASGDFDGDGVADLAYTLNSEGKNMVCVTRGDRTAVLAASSVCVSAGAGEELGTTLTAADLEGDGRDELLASAKVNGVLEVRALRLVDGKLESTTIGPKNIGFKLTTIYPGRPGKAKWAATAANQHSILIFEGTELRQRLLPPLDVARGFGRALR
jgi:hypothetical protein